MAELIKSINIGEAIGYVITFIMLFITLREIREMRKHQRALERHEEKLEAVRPLISTLYTSNDEIMKLAISFTREAKEIYALGSVSRLAQTEMKQSETESAFGERLQSVNPKTIAYISAIREYILSGRRYCRIMDCRPRDSSEESIWEILSNVNFYLRLLEFRGTSDIHLELYHHSEILKGAGDFHFRCSDQKVVIRVGGHGNQYANAAVVITDARVIREFQQYYRSLMHSDLARCLQFDHLLRLRDLLLARDIQGIENHLSQLPGGAS